MISAAALALRKGVRDALLANTALASRLGGGGVFDEAPRNVAPPYVVLGDVRSRDWSTATDSGAEHFLTLDVWTQHRGSKEALEILALREAALAGALIEPAGYRLVSIAPQSIETRRENGGKFVRARQTFRAVTENI